MRAADPPMAGFSGTAIKVTAEEMGLLSDEAKRAYDDGLKLDREGYALEVNTPQRLALHVKAHALYRRMAALVLEQLGG